MGEKCEETCLDVFDESDIPRPIGIIDRNPERPNHWIAFFSSADGRRLRIAGPRPTHDFPNIKEAVVALRQFALQHGASP
jgi:hypothetical protein